MGQALHLSGGLVSQIGTNTLEFNIQDRITAGTLTLGGVNTTQLDLATNAATTTGNIMTGAGMTALNIGTGMGTGDTITIGSGGIGGCSIVLDGDVTVQGDETVIGDSTFQGNIQLGDNIADTITYVGSVNSNIPFIHGSRSLTIANGATQANLTLKAADNSVAAGGDVILTPGAGATTDGNVRFGQTGSAADADFQIIASTSDATAEAGLRWAPTTAQWQVRYDGDVTWYNIITTATGGTVPDGTDVYQHLEWIGGAWTAVESVTLPNGSNRTISIEAEDTARSLTLSASSAATVTNSGGDTVIAGGAGLTTGAGGDLTLAGGASGVGGTGGDAYVRGGASSTNGNVYLGDTNTVNVFMGAGTNGIQYDSATNTLVAIGTGSINLDTTNNRLEINGGAVVHHANMTATNFAILFNGGDASALHTHAGLSSSDVSVSVTTDGSSTTFVCYITAADAIASAQANAATSSKAIGVRTAANTLMITGVTTIQMEGALTASIGDDLWLSATQAGAITNVAPSTAGQFLVYIGQAKTAGNTPSVYLRPERPLAL
jgi:hypothetical protein